MAKRYDVFVSYATKDEEFVKSMVAELRKWNWHVFHAPTSLNTGHEWEKGFLKEAERCRTFVAVYSNSYFASNNCAKEIDIAMRRIESQRDDIPSHFIPVLIEECEVPKQFQPRQWINLVNRDLDGYPFARVTADISAHIPHAIELERKAAYWKRMVHRLEGLCMGLVVLVAGLAIALLVRKKLDESDSETKNAELATPTVSTSKVNDPLSV